MLKTMFSVIPCESYISLFGITHIIILVLSLLATFYVVKHNRESKLFEKLMTIIMLGFYACIYSWYYFSPESFIVKGLPLYTCRIAVYMLAVGIFFNKEFWLKIGCYWGFFGGFFGLLLPTIFDYPFPHILQISTFFLHTYLFLISSYFLFVKKIGMNNKDLKICNIFTVGFLGLVTIVNILLGSNYSATLKMPGVLRMLGISFPTSLCFFIVASGYLIAIFVEYKLVNKYENKSLETSNND